jgi:hypothetical protein
MCYSFCWFSKWHKFFRLLIIHACILKTVHWHTRDSLNDFYHSHIFLFHVFRFGSRGNTCVCKSFVKIVLSIIVNFMPIKDLLTLLLWVSLFGMYNNIDLLFLPTPMILLMQFFASAKFLIFIKTPYLGDQTRRHPNTVGPTLDVWLV